MFENRTDLANDGDASEGDNLMDDVDIVFGGRAGDTLCAAAHGSSLIGDPDIVECGPDADRVPRLDVLSRCEGVFR